MVRITLVQKEIAANFPHLKFCDIKVSPGRNAEIFVLKSKSDETFLLKAIDKTKRKEKDLFGTEETALRRVESEHVIPLLELKETKRYKFFLFPFLEGHGLDEVLKTHEKNGQPFSNDEIFNFGKQLAQAVIDMNKVGVIHQDIKPKNIRVTPEGKYVLLDLGLARFKEQGKRGINRGAYGYSSPEQIYGALDYPYRPRVTFSADHWAIATIMYQMATLKHPFDMDSSRSVNEPIITPKKENPQIHNSIVEVLEKILNSKHASDRYPTPESLLDAFNGRPYQIPTVFDQPMVIFSLKRTPIRKKYVEEYKAGVGDDKFLPHGILLPANNAVPASLDPLKGQGYRLFVDPETYLQGVTNGSASLKQYFNQQNKDRLISATLGHQLKLGADYLITPYFAVEDTKENELALTTALYEESLKYLKNEGISVPLFGGLLVSRGILVSEESRKVVLDELLPATDGLEGIYLIAETMGMGSSPISDKEMLIGLRSFVETLGKKLPVILGYSDIFALGLIPSGLSGIVSHPYSSGRKINLNQIRTFIEKKKKGGKPPKLKREVIAPDQFYVPKLFNFIRVTGDLDQIIRTGIYDDEIGCNCPFCDTGIFLKAKTNTDILKTAWSIESRNSHFIYNLTKEVESMTQVTPEQARKNFLEKVKAAQKIYGQLKNDNIQLHEHSQGNFLKAWEESFS